MATFPQVLLRDLPLSPGTAEPYTFVAVDGNRNAVRVPAGVLTQQSVTRDPNIPATLDAPGSEGSLAFSCSSLYSYYAGQWGASPRYVNNIEDLDANTRFLLVNKEMNLTSEEQSFVKSSLNIVLASADNAGLVYGSATEKEGMTPITVEDGRMYLRDATATDSGAVTTTGEEGAVATKAYVDRQIDNVNRELVLPVATTTSLGGVLSGGDGDIFTVNQNGAVTIRNAEAGSGIPGIVSVASENSDSQLDSVVPVRLMRSVIEGVTGGTVPPASYTAAGTVKPVGTASGPLGALYLTDNYGTLDVYTATDSRYGVVKTISTIPSAVGSEDTTTVPNTGAVRKYVLETIAGEEGEGGGSTISPTLIPKATTSTIGGVIVGSRLTIDSSGILNAPIASTAANGYGMIRMSASYTSTSATTVPTSSALSNAYNALYSANQTLTSCFNALRTCFNALASRVEALE